MKKSMIAVLALSLMLCGCGKTAGTGGSAAGDMTEPTMVAITDPTTQTVTAVTEETEKAVSWFARGVYEQLENGEPTGLFYCFTDDWSGRTSSAENGIGVGFICEQKRDEVEFRMGGVNDVTTMSMRNAGDSRITGKLNGKTYTFRLVRGEDPEEFDAKEYMERRSEPDSEATERTTAADETTTTAETTSAASSAEEEETQTRPAVLQYEGRYVETGAGKAVIELIANIDGTYDVRINWSNSASDTFAWTCSGTFEDGTLVYDNAIKTHIVFDEHDESTTQTEYAGGKGSIVVRDQDLTWKDSEEGMADGLLFRRDG